ncbi:MAG: 6-carboxytetrahydropterin synthase QueD [Spirochaetia bacterium]|jgi:6-pyruvoyltetrahydropterin/6-carboxytetrahydropterin synthase|nr:6-carboxytetrahydropterin synthase QueD [Spirochaetia bacterium]
MYTVRAEDSFAAAHYLKNYHGKCENLHGHNYKVRVYVKGRELDPGGMLLDFGILKKMLKNILEEFDHKNLNEIPFFMEKDPSAELIAYNIFQKVKEKLSEAGGNCFLSRVEVFETEKNLAYYEEEDI